MITTFPLFSKWTLMKVFISSLTPQTSKELTFNYQEVEFLFKFLKSSFSFYYIIVRKTCGQKTNPTLGVLIKIFIVVFFYEKAMTFSDGNQRYQSKDRPIMCKIQTFLCSHKWALQK